MASLAKRSNPKSAKYNLRVLPNSKLICHVISLSLFVHSLELFGQFGQFSIYTLFSLGQYCIFKKGDCPKGLKKGYVFWDDENGKNINKKGGTLPDGIYDKDTLVYYCCRTDGDKYTPISLPVISPFYLKAFNTPECQRVEGAIATKEFIRFDTEDSGNKDRQNGSYPYGAGIANHLLFYCYYESR